jgi:hypothetical protein
MDMLLKHITRRWADSLGRNGQKHRIIGIYGQSRGGTNFVAAALHYHPRLFAANEHVVDYRIPLRSIWREGSVFRVDGRQEKQFDQIAAIAYNKMQATLPQLWNPRVDFPEGSRFVFYLRNPVRVHLSRETFRRNHQPLRIQWTDTRQHFLTLLIEAREIVEAYEILKERYPCCLLSHEYFCYRHEPALTQLHELLGVEPQPPGNARDFFRSCGRCGRPLAAVCEDGQEWLSCPRHRRPLSGSGRFNPLAPIDNRGIADDSWKTTPHIDRMMSDVRRILGDDFAQYFWDGRYFENLFARCSRANAA